MATEIAARLGDGGESALVLARNAVDPERHNGGSGSDAQQPVTTQELSAGDEELEQLDHYLTVSAGHLGLTLGLAHFFPPGLLLTLPLLVYLEWPIYKEAWNDLRDYRGIRVGGLMSIFVTGAWLTGAYFACAFSIFVYLLANRITAHTRDRSEKALIQLFDQQPQTVFVVLNGAEVEIPFAEITTGAIVSIHAGQVVPVDGTVVAGMGVVDQHRLTGESRPVEKGSGDRALAATILTRGSLQIRVESAGEDTLAAQIAGILEETTAYHLQIEQRGLALAESAVMPTLLISGLTLPFYGVSSALAALSAMPGVDMYFAGPLALLNFLHLAAAEGILVKDGRSLELIHTIDTIVFDKTGTLTRELFSVAEVLTYADWEEDQIITLAAAAERYQKHPVALSILAEAEARQLDLPPIAASRYEIGYGVQVEVDGQTVRLGSKRFMQMEEISLPPGWETTESEAKALGHSLVFVAIDEMLAGILILQPMLRPEVSALIPELRERGLDLYILSGDQEEPTLHLAEQLGIDNYFANVLPDQKSSFIAQLQNEGRKVCFVGDGINDAIALKQANVSISLNGATTIATDSAQIVFMEESLRLLPRLFDLANSLERNLMRSFGMSIGTGMGILIGVLGFHMGVGMAVAGGMVAMLGIVANAMLPMLKTLEHNRTAIDAVDGPAMTAKKVTNHA